MDKSAEKAYQLPAGLVEHFVRQAPPEAWLDETSLERKAKEFAKYSLDIFNHASKQADVYNGGPIELLKFTAAHLITISEANHLSPGRCANLIQAVATSFRCVEESDLAELLCDELLFYSVCAFSERHYPPECSQQLIDPMAQTAVKNMASLVVMEEQSGY